MKTTMIFLMILLIATAVQAQSGASYYYRPTATQPLPIMAGQVDYGTQTDYSYAVMPPEESYNPYHSADYQQALQGQQAQVRTSQFFYPGRSGLPYIAPGFQFGLSQQTPYAAQPHYRTVPVAEELTEYEQGYYGGYDEGYVAGFEGSYAGFEAYMAFKFYNDVRFEARPQVGYYVLNYQPKKITVTTVQTDYTDGYQAGLEAGFRDGFAQMSYQGIPPYARNQDWFEPSFGGSGKLSPIQSGYDDNRYGQLQMSQDIRAPPVRPIY